MNTKKGFTMIELLVVIGIIGVFAAIVMALTGNVGNQAKDSKIKASLNDLRKEAEVFFNDSDLGAGDYFITAGRIIPGLNGGSTISSVSGASLLNCSAVSSPAFFPSPSALKVSFLGQYLTSNGLSRGALLLGQATSTVGNNTLTRCYIRVDQPGWFVIVQLLSIPNAAWCVDGSGNSKQVAIPNGVGALASQMLPSFVPPGDYTCKDGT